MILGSFADVTPKRTADVVGLLQLERIRNVKCFGSKFKLLSFTHLKASGQSSVKLPGPKQEYIRTHIP